MNAIQPPYVARRLTDPHVQVWVTLRFAPHPLSIADILADVRPRAPMLRHSLSALLARWCQAGHVERVGQRPVRYLMTVSSRQFADPPVIAREPAHWTQAKPARQRLWAAARVMRSFDIVMLRMAADVRMERAADFIRILTRANYLRASTDTVGTTRWSWIERPGPLAPVVRRVDHDGLPHLYLIDRNTGARVTVPVRPHHQQRPKGWTGCTASKGGEINHVC